MSGKVMTKASKKNSTLKIDWEKARRHAKVEKALSTATELVRANHVHGRSNDSVVESIKTIAAGLLKTEKELLLKYSR